MGPTWVLSAPGAPHVGPMNFAIKGGFSPIVHPMEYAPLFSIDVFLCHSIFVLADCYEDFGTGGRYLRHGYVIVFQCQHWFRECWHWDAITYPCLRYLLRWRQSPYMFINSFPSCSSTFFSIVFELQVKIVFQPVSGFPFPSI